MCLIAVSFCESGEHRIYLFRIDVQFANCLGDAIGFHDARFIQPIRGNGHSGRIHLEMPSQILPRITASHSIGAERLETSRNPRTQLFGDSTNIIRCRDERTLDPFEALFEERFARACWDFACSTGDILASRRS